ncbi:hypothetical protein WME75_17755 [Sorangium sp. So ce1014]
MTTSLRATGPAGTRGTAFGPVAMYSYTADPTENVPALVKSYAGAGRI